MSIRTHSRTRFLVTVLLLTGLWFLLHFAFRIPAEPLTAIVVALALVAFVIEKVVTGRGGRRAADDEHAR